MGPSRLGKEQQELQEQLEEWWGGAWAGGAWAACTANLDRWSRGHTCTSQALNRSFLAACLIAAMV